LSPSKRISVGTVSMRSFHERSSAVSSSAPPSDSGKEGSSWLYSDSAARARICASTGSTSLQVSHSLFTTATNRIFRSLRPKGVALDLFSNDAGKKAAAANRRNGLALLYRDAPKVPGVRRAGQIEHLPVRVAELALGLVPSLDFGKHD